MSQRCWCCTIAILKDKTFGVAHVDALPGDEISTSPGCNAVVLLRSGYDNTVQRTWSAQLEALMCRLLRATFVQWIEQQALEEMHRGSL